MIKGSIKGTLNFPRINTIEQLEQIAFRVIRPDIQKRMKSGIDLSGNPHKPNATSTRLYKALRGLKTSVPLVASGQLLSSFRIDFVGKDTVRISPRGLRQPYKSIKKKYRLRGRSKGGKEQPTNMELADILQNQGVRRGGHKYEFFGISREAEKRAIKWMIRYIRKAIKDGGQKTVIR